MTKIYVDLRDGALAVEEPTRDREHFGKLDLVLSAATLIELRNEADTRDFRRRSGQAAILADEGGFVSLSKDGLPPKKGIQGEFVGVVMGQLKPLAGL